MEEPGPKRRRTGWDEAPAEQPAVDMSAAYAAMAGMGAFGGGMGGMGGDFGGMGAGMGGGGGGGMGGAIRGFKTQMCKFHMQGSCHKGAACTYAHSQEECTGTPGKGQAFGEKGGGGKGGGGCWGAGGGMTQPAAGISMEMMMAAAFGGEGMPASQGMMGGMGGKGKFGGKGGGKGFKTQLCKYFSMGSCHKGEGCSFAHGEHELGGGGGAARGGMQALGMQQQAASNDEDVYAQFMVNAAQEQLQAQMGQAAGAGGQIDLEAMAAMGADPAMLQQMAAAQQQMAQMGQMQQQPQDGQQGQRGFKTKMCNFFAQGRCQKGEACSYAHGEHEMQARPAFQGAEGGTPSGYKTRPCKFFMMGSCNKGETCMYAHGETDVQQGGGKGGAGACGSSWGAAPAGGGFGGWGKGGGKGGGGGGFKTRMCTFHQQGTCTKGAACTFAHHESELSPGGKGGKGGGGGCSAGIVLPAALQAAAAARQMAAQGAFAAPQEVSLEDQLLMQQMQEAAGAEGFPEVAYAEGLGM